MNAIAAWIGSFNWAAPTWDFFILFFFFVGAFLYGLSLGKDRVIVILVGLYMALGVVSNIPSFQSLTLAFRLNDQYVLRVTLFLGLFVVLFFLLSRSALLKTLAGSGAGGPWWQTLVLSLFQMGLLISIVLGFLPREITSHLGALTSAVFVSDQGRSAWLILPIVCMAFLPKSTAEDISAS